MIIRNKYIDNIQKNIENIKLDKIPMKFNIEHLNMVCSYVISDNKLITRSSLMKTKRLFNNLDEKMYIADEQLNARLYFINRALEARIDENMENVNIIKNYCLTEKYGDLIENLINDIEERYVLKAQEINYINSLVSQRLSYSYLFSYEKILRDLLEKFEVQDFESYSSITSEFKVVLSGFLTKIRESEKTDGDTRFDLTNGNFENVIIEAVKRLQSPGYSLQTGSQMLNTILGSGFEKRRVYLFMGLTGGFKSGILLSISKWIKYYNIKYECKDPTKRPTLLFITQENTLDETIERLFNMTITSESIKKFTPNQVVDLLRTKGRFTLTEDNNVDVVIKYYGNEKISTEDLYTISAELEDEGRELICLIHDYINRIRPADSKIKEIKEKLGAIANEFKNFAIEKDIPVITAAQLNRDASKVIDSAIEGGKEDLARLLGRSNIAESWSLLQNVDWACIINKEYSKFYKRNFLTFKRIKIRYHVESNITYFNHPFHETNEMYILDDLNGECLSKFSLSSDIENNEFGRKGRKSGIERKQIEDKNGDEYVNNSNFDEYLKQTYKK